MKTVVIKDDNNPGKYIEIAYKNTEIISVTNNLDSLELVEINKERLKNELVKKTVKIE